MKIKFILATLFSVCCTSVISQKLPATTEIRNDLKKIYDEYNVEGTFILYNSKSKKYIVYNEPLLNQPSTPASTFHILCTLIGLQENIINEHSILKDTVFHHKDFPLDTAFRRNIEWCFWSVSRMAGNKTIKKYLDKIQYGNTDTTDGAERFWAGRSLKITPLQQLDFIQKFYYRRLPFSKRNFSIVKKMMVEKDTINYKIVGKRGSYKVGERYLGWFVGYVETAGNVYFFANYIQSSDLKHPTLVNAQKDVVFKILKELKITE